MASLNFKANPKQKEAFKFLFDKQHTDIGYGGGAGGGKSYVWVSWLWMMCNKYAGVRYAIGRQELKRLKQTTLNSFFKFIGDYEIPEDQAGHYNSQEGVIKFKNGSEILLLDLAFQPSDPLYTRLGSLELTGAFVDESNEVDEQCLVILSTRIGRQKNDEHDITPKLLQSFNPDKGHVYRNFYKPYKEDTLPPYRVFIPALATDNEFVSKNYIAQLEKADEVTKQRLLYGNFDYDSTPGRLFDFEKLQCLFSNVLPESSQESFISIDVARQGKDKTVIVIWRWLEVVEILTEDKSRLDTLTTFIKQLAQQYSVPPSRIVVDENWVGGGLIDNLRCQGFINNSSPLQPRNPNLSQTRNFEHLKTQCYWELGKLVNENLIRINCKETYRQSIIDELDAIVQIDIDKDGKIKLIKKDDIKVKLWRSPDYADALMMRMLYEVKKWSIVKPTQDIVREYDEILDFSPVDDDNDISNHPY